MNVLLVDGFNLIRRLYEARPHGDEPVQEETITSAAQSLKRALRQHQPSHVCCIFESHDRTWRHEQYPGYKANRKPTPPPLLDALGRFESAFGELGVRCLTLAGFEADDVIATLAHGISKANGRVVILSTDKNFLQLLDNNIIVYDHFNETEYSQNWVVEKYGVGHQQLTDYWAMTGDSSCNIKGVPKVGPKTAQQLIQAFGTLDHILDDSSNNKHANRVKEHQQEALDSRKLMTLKTDVKVGINLNELRYIPDQ